MPNDPWTATAYDYGLPQGWRNGQPGGGAVQAMWGHRRMLAQQAAMQQAQQAELYGYLFGGDPARAGSTGQNWGANQGPNRGGGPFGGGPQSTGFSADPYGGGGMPNFWQQHGGSMMGGINPLLGAIISGFNNPANSLFGNGNFENPDMIGRNFMGPPSSTQGVQQRNPISNFLDWLRSRVSNR